MTEHLHELSLFYHIHFIIALLPWRRLACFCLLLCTDLPNPAKPTFRYSYSSCYSSSTSTTTATTATTTNIYTTTNCRTDNISTRWHPTTTTTFATNTTTTATTTAAATAMRWGMCFAFIDFKLISSIYKQCLTIFSGFRNCIDFATLPAILCKTSIRKQSAWAERLGCPRKGLWSWLVLTYLSYIYILLFSATRNFF